MPSHTIPHNTPTCMQGGAEAVRVDAAAVATAANFSLAIALAAAFVLAVAAHTAASPQRRNPRPRRPRRCHRHPRHHECAAAAAVAAAVAAAGYGGRIAPVGLRL